MHLRFEPHSFGSLYVHTTFRFHFVLRVIDGTAKREPLHEVLGHLQQARMLITPQIIGRYQSACFQRMVSSSKTQHRRRKLTPAITEIRA